MTKPANLAFAILGLALLLQLNLRAAERVIKPEDRAWWAFQKITRPNAPEVKNRHWVRNPIDAFILASLEAKHLSPSPAADKATLLRRAYLDMLGLPPTPAEVDAFLADKSPRAFDKVVDRLLASPHYGERWGRHWLDLARFAESEGFKADETRPNAWRYRDYVIESFNSDKPYDRFVEEQLAGDELWPNDPAARVATGFNRHYPDESNARDLLQRRQEILNDMTDATTSVFLGLTCGCARCHDHKYDPILQADYYRLQAFFAATHADDEIPLYTPREAKQYDFQLTKWKNAAHDILQERDTVETRERNFLTDELFRKYPADIQAAYNKPLAERTPMERWYADKVSQYMDPHSHEFVGGPPMLVERLKPEEKKRWKELTAELNKYSSLRPADLPVGIGIVDLGCEAPKTCVLSRGVYDKPKAEVQPAFLTVIDPALAKIVAPKNLDSTGRRTALAKILVDPNNPLTARVMVNRIWSYHFGAGIVGTPSDFGTRGDPPTNPQLLDWLASEFVRNQWSIKHLHRLILTSDTYRQSSAFRDDAATVDPDDKFLWRFPRHRLEGEVIRDSALAVSGLLNSKLGGPSVFPELPDGMPTPSGSWNINEDHADRNRRSIYIFVRRNTRYPMFDAFDMPDPHESCPRRNVTTGPIQALTLLNSKLTLEWAQNFAGRVLKSAGTDTDRQIDTAFRLAYGHSPDAEQLKTVEEFFQNHHAILAERLANGEKLALPPQLSLDTDRIHAATLVDLCHTLINMDEFVYRN